MSRRGRPPKVVEAGNNFSVKVKGAQYEFRQGEDGKLRALGTPERNEDFAYAKEQVERVLNAPAKPV